MDTSEELVNATDRQLSKSDVSCVPGGLGPSHVFILQRVNYWCLAMSSVLVICVGVQSLCVPSEAPVI